MMLTHVFSYRRWQRELALLSMTTFVIVKGARESVRDR
jgi:hypothetical protein